MRASFFAVTALIGIMCLPAMAQDTAFPSVTLKEVFANPGLYLNKTVRVRGQINACFAWGCRICEAGEDWTCAGFDFAVESEGASDRATQLRVERYMQRQYRFAEVTLEAMLDPQCLGNYLMARQLADGTPIGICSDSAPALTHTRVTALHVRKSGREYETELPSREALVLPDDTERQAMLAAFEPHFAWASDVQTVVFLEEVEEDIYAAPREADLGFGCACREEDCEDKWPLSPNASLDSPANPYICFQMEKQNGVWRAAFSFQ